MKHSTNTITRLCLAFGVGMVLFLFYINFYIDLFYSQLAAMSPYKGDTPHLWIIKEKLGDQYYLMNDSDGFYLRISYYINIERRISFSNKHNLQLKNILFWFCYLQSKQQVFKNCRCKYTPCAICSSSICQLFLVDAMNWKCLYLFLLILLE